jgi:hypothetical protein
MRELNIRPAAQKIKHAPKKLAESLKNASDRKNGRRKLRQRRD